MKVEGQRALDSRYRWLIFRALILAALFLAGAGGERASGSGHSPALRVLATSDSTEVHPDDVFEVTLSLRNLGNTVQKITVPETGWDRDWKSSNRRVTWDAWECDEDSNVTVEIAPGDTYVFPKTLRMFVDDNSGKESHMTFSMGFKTAGFGKTLWSAPMTLDVIP